MMRGFICVIKPFGEDAMGKVYVVDYNDLPEGVVLTKSLVYEFFDKGRKLHNIKGKQFNFILNGEYYYIGQVVLSERLPNGKIRRTKTFKTYSLGEIVNEYS